MRRAVNFHRDAHQKMTASLDVVKFDLTDVKLNFTSDLSCLRQLSKEYHQTTAAVSDNK